MPTYSAFVALDSGPGHYREIEELIDAPDSRTAAQQLIELGTIDPGDCFPLILVIEEPAAWIFIADYMGQATDEDLHLLSATRFDR
jgi:hypothetical protein